MPNFDHSHHAIKWIAVKNLSVVWANAQRPLREKHAKNIADNLDPDLFGTLTVTLPNGSGIYHIVDGRHRKTAIQSLWGDNEQVPCLVLNITDPKEAAGVFDKVNTYRLKPQPIDAFMVRLTAGYETEVAVNNIIGKHNYRVARGNREGNISAVSALVSVYRSYGPETLKSTLQILQATWGMSGDAVGSPLLRGYGAFLAEYGAKANWQRLIECVRKEYTPGQFMNAVRHAREFTHLGVAETVKYVLIKRYDSGLRKGKIGKGEDG